MSNMWILAQAADEQMPSGITGIPVTEQETTATTTALADPNAAPVKAPPKSPIMTFLPLVRIGVMMYFLLLRGPRKQKKKKKEMVQSLQKNDKVQTIGGILGTIIDVKDDEITLKIDESNNTKMKVTAGAISKKVSKEID